MIKIVSPKPMKKSEMMENLNIRYNEREDIWIDFSREKIKKALFLDIDGVIQPFTEYRFKYVHNDAEMEQLFKKLEDEFEVDYREFDKYDVAAAYYDWDKDAVKEIKRILDETGAKIVVSSSWRSGTTGDYFPFLLRMHGLQKYLYGYTPIFFKGLPKYEDIKRTRSIEILEYLRMHPHIKKWVAVDDIDLDVDFPKNAVVTYPNITTSNADKCIKILGKLKRTA
ncbi:MAG: HAD domain-containing protein [Fibromonadales bacterium]|nr:HAD domain-containing protein [Fibromonadales bacterium]